MRMSQRNICIIKDTFLRHFQDARIFLFGSRTDDEKKGGDIDLLILSDVKYNLKKISLFRVELIKKIGDRKIDILNYKYNDNSLFLKEVLYNAIEL